MIRKLSYPGTNLEDLNIYYATTEEEARECIERGVPFIPWRGRPEVLVKILLAPILRKRFPGIKTPELHATELSIFVADPRDHEYSNEVQTDEETEDPTLVDSEIVGYSDGKERPIFTKGKSRKLSSAEVQRMGEQGMAFIEKYAQEKVNVDIEALISLELLPHFVGKIADVVRRNLYGRRWTEGYNKKRRCPLGNFDAEEEADNLIIVDVSYSIPRGVSATMLTILDYMRLKLRADVIVTGGRSMFWPYGSELPTPEKLREIVPMGNESADFRRILLEDVKGKRYDNVVSFGDNDCPDLGLLDPEQYDIRAVRGSRVAQLRQWYLDNLSGTEIGDVYHFHTRSAFLPTGYAKWAEALAQGSVHYDDSWVTGMWG